MVRLHGGLALVTAAWITPDTFAEPPATPLPTLIGVKRLDQGWLSGLAASPYILAPEASLSPTPLSDNAQLFRGANGQIIGQIFWEVATPGHALRYDILPGLLVLCIGMLGMVISAARYFYGVSTHLVRATKIAMTDALTGLGNRAGLEAVLHTDPARRAVAEGHIAVLYLDLDAFKPLNDTYGHHVGDIALKEIAARLQKAVRKSDIVVRLGGDEFVCVIFDTDPGAASHRVADRVIAFMQDPIVFPDHRQVIRVSIGLALGGPGIPWPMLLEQADVAMYRAKSRASHDPVQFTTDVPGAPQAA